MKTIAYALLTILLSTSLALACATRNPTAVITGQQARIEHGTQLTFSGTSSYDNDEGGSRIDHYYWYLDGSYERYGSSYTVTFNLPEGVNERTYAVKLKVRDNDRQYGYKTVYVTVKRPKHFYFYVKDHLGSTRAVVDDAGDVVEAYDYYPFGLQSRSYKEKGDPLTKETFTGKEEDIESKLHYFGARYYDAGAAKFLSVDPKYYLYPFTSPYVYTINNPINYIDPNGMEVVFSDSSQAAEAAAALNEVNEGADISVETETEEHSLFFGLITWTSTTYKLSTSGSNFDWGQNIFTMALYDVINTTEVTFNMSLVDGKSTGWPITIFDRGGGIANSYAGGSDIIISNTGNRVGDPMGVVIMHELVGHGHPAGGLNAHSINKYYQQKLKYKREPYGYEHPGYHSIIGWKKTGLYKGKK